MPSLTWASRSRTKLAPPMGGEPAPVRFVCIRVARPSKEKSLTMVGEAIKSLALQCDAIAASRLWGGWGLGFTQPASLA
jgi:hypothetical protein